MFWKRARDGNPEGQALLGDLVRDAERHRIEIRITCNGRPAARIARLAGLGGNAAECEKMLARTQTIPASGPEREAVSIVQAALAKVAGKEHDAR